MHINQLLLVTAWVRKFEFVAARYIIVGLTLPSSVKFSGWLRLGVIRLVHNVGSRGEHNLALQLQVTNGSFVQIDLVWVSKRLYKPRELEPRRLIAFLNPIRENLERGSQKFCTRLRDIMGWPCSLYAYWHLVACERLIRWLT